MSVGVCLEQQYRGTYNTNITIYQAVGGHLCLSLIPCPSITAYTVVIRNQRAPAFVIWIREFALLSSGSKKYVICLREICHLSQRNMSSGSSTQLRQYLPSSSGSESSHSHHLDKKIPNCLCTPVNPQFLMYSRPLDPRVAFLDQYARYKPPQE